MFSLVITINKQIQNKLAHFTPPPPQITRPSDLNHLLTFKFVNGVCSFIVCDN